jgi:Fe-S cluster assembly protein SufD
MTILFKGDTVVSTLPPHLSFDNGVLSIKNNLVLADPLVIEITDPMTSTFGIHVGQGSDVKIILEIRMDAKDDDRFQFDLFAQANARIKYLLVSEVTGKAHLSNRFFGRRDAHLDLIGAFASNDLSASISVDLLEEGAEAKLRAVAISSDHHNQLIDVLITHKAKNTFGDMTNIGIANQSGKITLNGVEKILKGMKQANAFQTLKGIIMSDQARVEVNPILLIDEYDVKAGHGATIGKIDEDALFYLKSRGLTSKEAERLVINGFLNPVINDIDDAAIRERFVAIVNQRI